MNDALAVLANRIIALILLNNPPDCYRNCYRSIQLRSRITHPITTYPKHPRSRAGSLWHRSAPRWNGAGFPVNYGFSF
jgi:hypothetical protein